MFKRVKIFTDGGARGNPGPAGIGIVIIDSETGDKKTYKKYIGVATNNKAEYSALLLALQKAHELGAEHVSCYLDSELVVKQMRREYKVKNPDLAVLFLKAWNLSSHFASIEWHHIFREKNKEADALVNQAIDLENKVSFY